MGEHCCKMMINWQDPSLRDLVAKTLPLAVSFRLTSVYIEKHSAFQFGLVNHALCACIRELQKVSS